MSKFQSRKRRDDSKFEANVEAKRMRQKREKPKQAILRKQREGGKIGIMPSLLYESSYMNQVYMLFT